MSALRWFHYRQNNSGGRWKSPALNVFVEAPSVAVANALAEMHGLYFDGSGDCPCCGDRWSTPWDDDGRAEPELYGEPVTAASARSSIFQSLYDGVVKAMFIRVDGSASSKHPITGEDCA